MSGGVIVQWNQPKIRMMIQPSKLAFVVSLCVDTEVYKRPLLVVYVSLIARTQVVTVPCVLDGCENKADDINTPSK